MGSRNKVNENYKPLPFLLLPSNYPLIRDRGHWGGGCHVSYWGLNIFPLKKEESSNCCSPQSLVASPQWWL